MKGNRALVLIAVWLLVMVSVVASTVTLLASEGVGGGRRWVSGDEYVLLQRYARLEQVRQTLSDGFYSPVDDETLLTGALRGMMASLGDPYTFYYTPEEMAEHLQQTGGEYCGVGLLVQNNPEGYIEIIRVYEDGPGDRAGLRAGDRIIAVDGASVRGGDAGLNETVALLKGERDSRVRLTVLRGSEKLDAELVRGDVTVNNVVSSMIGEDIGYIDIFQFSTGAADEFRTALQALQDRGARRLIIDLRNNPGGALDAVLEIADALLGEGTIVYTMNREGSRRDYYSDAACCDLPLAVLVNEMSASASEILAAAVQDYGRGAVLGKQTFGKGIVQTVVTFEDDGAGMQFTSECYYTPKGSNIHGLGVTPDVIVEAAEDFSNYTGVPDLENDVQLRAAIELIEAE